MADAHRSDTLEAPALRALLADIIDYAGIFPPARLPLDEAIANYAEYLTSSKSWILGRFVIPAGRLSELDDFSDLFERRAPFRFSILAGGGESDVAFLDAFDEDLASIASFREQHGDRVSVDAFEMRFPPSLLATDVITVGRFVRDVDARLAEFDLQQADLFFEIPLDQNHRQTTPIAAGAVHAFNRNRKIDEHGTAGLKMRTGGTEADAFPSAESVAAGIAACRDAGIPFKATAGLHHPLRHYSSSVGANMHGFFNVFVAAALATSEHAQEPDLVTVLLEEDPGAFTFSDDKLEWKGHVVDIDVVARVRRDRAVSFGSCSFIEPVDDLRELGLL